MMLQNGERSAVLDAETLDREIGRARSVQARLFPQERPRLRTLRYAGDSESAGQLGGDYYDFLRFDRNRLGIALGDVSGKGVPAALLTANLHALVRARARANPGGLEAMTVEINRQLCRSTDDATFVSLFFGAYDDRSRSFRYVNAGHNPPILVRTAGSRLRVKRFASEGMVLGIFPDRVYREREVHLDEGDLLVVFSDGVTETENGTGEQFGDTRLVELVVRNRAASPEALVRRISGSLSRFRGGSPRKDDTTLIVARVLGRGGRV
jgi:sigma-B regulation protein RsbU (phosphoserine phosphatase)